MERESRELFRVTGEEVEKIPLRHEGDELAAGGKVREIDDGHDVAIDDRMQLARFLVRHFQEFIEQSKLVHKFERGGMNGVAAKIAVEIGMLLQHRDFHTGARQQITGHHSSRSAANDDATHADSVHG
jgi:hypothetical protein